MTRGLFGVVLAIAALTSVARAHPLAPAALTLREVPDAQPGTLEVTFRQSRLRPSGEALRPRLPARCADVPDTEREVLTAEALETRRTVRCGPGPWAGLGGASVGVDGLVGSPANVVLSLHLIDGRTVDALLHNDAPTHRFDARAESDASPHRGFLRLGVEHLLTGADHVLFVLGLVLLVASLRRLVWMVSAFTVGHSVSLALVAYDVVRPASAWVEVFIAVSLLWLALAVLDRAWGKEQTVASASRAAGVCVAFGVVHGLGFASVLSDAGTADASRPLAVFAFNVGVEIGQLALVVPAYVALRALRARAAAGVESRVAWAGGYVVGAASAFWLIERLPTVVRVVLP